MRRDVDGENLKMRAWSPCRTEYAAGERPASMQPRGHAGFDRGILQLIGRDPLKRLPHIIAAACVMAAAPILVRAQVVGFFTAAQAQSGAAVYSQNCAACHGATLGGGLGPPLKGPDFAALAASKHFTVGSLLDTISRTMPLTAPHSLSADNYAAVTAYILQQSGYSAGSVALAVGSAGINDVALVKAPGGSATAITAPSDSAGRLASTGVYSTVQMERGKTVYSENCLTCHGGELDGLEGAPPLAGKPFMDRWGGRTVAALERYISTQMPPGNGGAVGASGETDIIAYILAKNGFQAGPQSLPTGSQQQAGITIDRK